MLEHTKISRMSLICWQLQIRVYWSVEYLDALRRWSVPSAMDRCSVDVWHKSIIKLNWNTFLSLCIFQISWTYCSKKWITKRVLLWQREGLLKRSAIHKPDRDKKKVQRGLWTNIHFWFHKILHCHWKVCSQRILTFSPPCFLFSSWHLWPSWPVRGARRPSGNKPLNQPRLPPATFLERHKKPAECQSGVILTELYTDFSNHLTPSFQWLQRVGDWPNVPLASELRNATPKWQNSCRFITSKKHNKIIV